MTSTDWKWKTLFHAGIFFCKLWYLSDTLHKFVKRFQSAQAGTLFAASDQTSNYKWTTKN